MKDERRDLQKDQDRAWALKETMKVERSRWNETSWGKVEKESSKTEAHRNKKSGHEEENECQKELEEWGLGIDQWGKRWLRND